jgi:hypothetical protein
MWYVINVTLGIGAVPPLQSINGTDMKSTGYHEAFDVVYKILFLSESLNKIYDVHIYKIL